MAGVEIEKPVPSGSIFVIIFRGSESWAIIPSPSRMSGESLRNLYQIFKPY
jgi:hypothetical protein